LTKIGLNCRLTDNLGQRTKRKNNSSITFRSGYIQIRNTTNNFWNVSRIEHIRHLAQTGRAVKPLETPLTHERLLDRLSFTSFNMPLEDCDADVDLAVSLAYGSIKLAAPIYFGDMSFGALSGIPNIALAKAADLTETLAGTGEGGLHPEVRKCKRITVQWASARFGVDLSTLSAGMAVVIKIGQGAKPGIGGHLPSTKVTDIISATRKIPVGTHALSPAPHHDIYSIEDLEQRIWALKEATGKPVFVKVGATNYVAYVACGIARMGADGMILDGFGAGTGASPLVVKDNVGLPIEVALPVVDEALRRECLRDGFSVIAGGRVSCSADAAKLILLGADAVVLGTAALIAMGCIACGMCHTGKCPALLTNAAAYTTHETLSLDWATSRLVNFVKGFSEGLKILVSGLGFKSVKDIVGRKDLLKFNEALTYSKKGVGY